MASEFASEFKHIDHFVVKTYRETHRKTGVKFKKIEIALQYSVHAIMY